MRMNGGNWICESWETMMELKIAVFNYLERYNLEDGYATSSVAAKCKTWNNGRIKYPNKNKLEFIVCFIQIQFYIVHYKHILWCAEFYGFYICAIKINTEKSSLVLFNLRNVLVYSKIFIKVDCHQKVKKGQIFRICSENINQINTYHNSQDSYCSSYIFIHLFHLWQSILLSFLSINGSD